MRRLEEFVKNGKVSIWIGQIGSEDELLSYVDDGQFETDFDFQGAPSEIRELSASDDLLPVSKLVEGFSWYEQYKEACIRKADEQKIDFGRCMVVLFGFEYELCQNAAIGSPLRFIGAFDLKQKATN